MTVETYDYAGLGYAIDPESDTKQRTVILLGLQTVKCNPRPVVIYVTGGAVKEGSDKIAALSDHCAENKIVFMCPYSTDCDELVATYKYIDKNYLDLNVKKDEISIKAAAGCEDAAQELADYLLDELDIEVGDVEVF